MRNKGLDFPAKTAGHSPPASAGENHEGTHHNRPDAMRGRFLFWRRKGRETGRRLHPARDLFRALPPRPIGARHRCSNGLAYCVFLRGANPNNRRARRHCWAVDVASRRTYQVCQIRSDFPFGDSSFRVDFAGHIWTWHPGAGLNALEKRP